MDDYASSDVYSDVQKTAIAFAEQWTRGKQVDHTLVAGLAQAIGPEQVVKLAAAVAQANWTNRFNNSFDVQLP